MPLSVIAICCKFVTPVRFTVAVLPEKTGLPETLPSAEEEVRIGEAERQDLVAAVTQIEAARDESDESRQSVNLNREVPKDAANKAPSTLTETLIVRTPIRDLIHKKACGTIQLASQLWPLRVETRRSVSAALLSAQQSLVEADNSEEALHAVPAVPKRVRVR